MTLNLIRKNKTRKDKVYNSNYSNRGMKKTVSAVDYFNGLKGIDAIQIREDYKKGNNLNDIIQHHKTKKPEALSKIFNLIKFEFDEQERFLRTYETIDEVGLFFFPLNQETYAKIIDATLKGIREGTQDFLNRQNSFSLYLSDLSAFCYDDTLRSDIKESINRLGLKLYRKEKIQYAEDIRSRYCGFVFNESRQKFNEKFKKK